MLENVEPPKPVELTVVVTLAEEINSIAPPPASAKVLSPRKKVEEDAVPLPSLAVGTVPLARPSTISSGRKWLSTMLDGRRFSSRRSRMWLKRSKRRSTRSARWR